MAVILKSNPSGITDGAFTSSPVDVYQKCAPRRGEEVFVWTSQTAKGMGLAMHGTFLEKSPPTGKRNRVVVQVAIASQLSEPCLTIEELKKHNPETNPVANGPLCTLYKKLCDNSHNKIGTLDRDEVEELNKRFNSRSHIVAAVFTEGDPIFRRHLARERQDKAIRVKKANAARPLACEVCDFRFAERYEDATDFIECHHLLPLARGGPRATHQKDLILCCANCHRIIHRQIRFHPDDPRNTSAAGLRQAILLPDVES